jgi:hypothetical protein
MKHVLIGLAMIGAVALSGCTGQIPIPRETVTFVYKFAEQRQQNQYHVKVLRGRIDDPPACGLQVEDIMRLDQIAVVVQRLGNPSLLNACADRFSADVATLRATAPNLATFEFYPLAGTSDRRMQLFINFAALGNQFPRPTYLQIQTNGAVIEGAKNTDGFAEIKFGEDGPVYRCEGRPNQIFWDDHILSPQSDTFFEFTLTSYDPSTHGLGAQFQCLARNASDPSDNRLLLVMLGSVFMTAEN